MFQQQVGASGNVKDMLNHQMVKEVAGLSKPQTPDMNQLPNAAARVSHEVNLQWKVSNAVDATGVEFLDGTMATGVEALAKTIIQLTADQPIAGSQKTLLNNGSEQVVHKEDTQATAKPKGDKEDRDISLQAENSSSNGETAGHDTGSKDVKSKDDGIARKSTGEY